MEQFVFFQEDVWIMSETPWSTHSFLRFSVLFVREYVKQNANVTVGYSTDMREKKITD